MAEAKNTERKWSLFSMLGAPHPAAANPAANQPSTFGAPPPSFESLDGSGTAQIPSWATGNLGPGTLQPTPVEPFRHVPSPPVSARSDSQEMYTARGEPGKVLESKTETIRIVRDDSDNITMLSDRVARIEDSMQRLESSLQERGSSMQEYVRRLEVDIPATYATAEQVIEIKQSIQNMLLRVETRLQSPKDDNPSNSDRLREFDETLVQERLRGLEDAVQGIMTDNRVSALEEALRAEDLQGKERISILEEAVQHTMSEVNKVASEMNVLVADMKTGYSSHAESTGERLNVMEDSMKHVMEIKSSQNMLKESERLTMLENRLASDMRNMSSDLSTRYASVERLTMMEDRLMRKMDISIEKVSSQCSKLEKKVLGPEANYASLDRLVILEDTVQRIAKINIETQMLKASERATQFENRVNSDLSRVTSEINKVVSETRSGYASADRLTIMEDMVQRIMSMNVDSRIIKESERVTLLEKMVQHLKSQVYTESREDGSVSPSERVESQGCGDGQELILKFGHRVSVLEDALQRNLADISELASTQHDRVSSLENALKGKEEQAQQRVGSLEESVRCLQEDMPVQFSSVDRVNLLEDLVRSIESNYFDMSKEDKELDRRLKGVEGSVERIMADDRLCDPNGSSRAGVFEEAMHSTMSDRMSLLEDKVLDLGKTESEIAKVASQMRAGYVSLDRLAMLEDRLQSKIDVGVDSKMWKVSERCSLLEKKVASEMEKVTSEMRTGYASVERLNNTEAAVRLMVEKNVESQMSQASQRCSLLEKQLESLKGQFTSEMDKISSEMRTGYATLDQLTITEGMVQRRMELNIESQMLKTSEQVSVIKDDVATEMASTSASVEASVERLAIIEDALQRIMDMNIEKQLVNGSEKVDILENKMTSEVNTVSSEISKVALEMMNRFQTIESQMLKDFEQVSLLENKVPEIHKAISVTNTMVSDLQTEKASAERLTILEAMVQRIIETNLESQILKESERVSRLEKTVQSIDGILEAKISENEQKGQENVSVLDETVQNNMSVVMAEISKVASEMRLSYVTIDRLAGLESTLQHKMENFKEKESEQSSLLVRCQDEIASELSNVMSQFDAIRSEMRATYAPVELMMNLENTIKEMNAETQTKATEQINLLENKITFEMTRAVSEMNKAVSEARTASAPIERLAVLADTVQRVETQLLKDSDRVGLLETKVAADTSKMASEMSKVASELKNVASEMRTEYAPVGRLTTMEDRVQQMTDVNIEPQILKLSERCSLVEKELAYEVGKITSEVSKVVSDTRAGYVSVERFSILESMVQRTMDMNIESQIVPAEQISLVQKKVDFISSEFDKFMADSASTERLNILEATVNTAMQQIEQMSKDLVKENERASLLENKTQDIESKSKSEMEKFMSEMQAYVHIPERLTVLDGTVQHMIGMKLEKQVSKESERLSKLENKFSSDISKVNSDMNKIVCEMRTEHATIERLSLLENKVHSAVSDERVSSIEEALHRMTGMNFEQQISKESERIGQLESQVSSIIDVNREQDGKILQDAERLNQVEDKVMSEMLRAVSETRAACVPIERIHIVENSLQRMREQLPSLEDTVRGMTDMNLETRMLKESERISLLETKVTSEMSKVSSEMRDLKEVASATRTASAPVERLDFLEDTVRRMMDMNLETQMSKESERVGLLENSLRDDMSKVTTQMGKVTAELNQVTSEMRISYAPVERLNMMEGRLQQMMEMNIDVTLSKESARLSLVEDKVQGVASDERVSALEDTVRQIMADSRVQAVDAARSLQERTVFLQEALRDEEQKRKDAMQYNADKSAKIDILEEAVQCAMSEMNKVVSEIRTGYVPFERFASMEGSVQRIMDMNIDPQMLKSSERVDLLENKVAVEVSNLSSEINKVLSEMRTDYASVDRLVITEGTVQHMMEVNIESRMLKESERLSMLESKVQSMESQSRVQGDNQASGERDSLREDGAQRGIGMADADALRERVDMLAETVQHAMSQMNRVALEMNKIVCELETRESQMMKESERITFLESKVKSIEIRGGDGDQAAGDRGSQHEDGLQRVADSVSLNILETKLREEERRRQERFDVLEEAVNLTRSEMQRVFAEVTKITSEMQTGYERISAVESEGTVQRMMERNFESQMVEESERIGVFENKVFSQMSKVTAEMTKNASDMRTGLERLTIVEAMVQRMVELNVESKIAKISLEVQSLLAGDTAAVDPLKDAMPELVKMSHDRVDNLEASVKHTMSEVSKVSSEMTRAMSEIRTGYAPIERLTVIEGRLQRMMEMKIESNITKDGARASDADSQTVSELAFGKELQRRTEMEAYLAAQQQELSKQVQECLRTLNAKVDEVRMQTPRHIRSSPGHTPTRTPPHVPSPVNQGVFAPVPQPPVYGSIQNPQIAVPQATLQSPQELVQATISSRPMADPQLVPPTLAPRSIENPPVANSPRPVQLTWSVGTLPPDQSPYPNHPVYQPQ